MLTLRVYAPRDAVGSVLDTLDGHAGVEHVMTMGSTPGDGVTLVTADVAPHLIDVLLPSIAACGVGGDEIEVDRNTASRPLGRADHGDVTAWSGGALAWTDLTKRSRPYARAVPQYVVYMVCAGVVAVFGILTSNPILIVGAMAISPDLLPMCATCVGIVDRHPHLAVRAFLALVIGLTVAAFSAFSAAALLRAGRLPARERFPGRWGSRPVAVGRRLHGRGRLRRRCGRPALLPDPVQFGDRRGDLDHHDPGRRFRGGRPGSA